MHDASTNGIIAQIKLEETRFVYEGIADERESLQYFVGGATDEDVRKSCDLKIMIMSCVSASVCDL